MYELLGVFAGGSNIAYTERIHGEVREKLSLQPEGKPYLLLDRSGIAGTAAGIARFKTA